MISILGASGFIGRHLEQRLVSLGTSYNIPARDAYLHKTPLGHVIYCIGLTADFRNRPFDTIEAHVTKLSHLLQAGDFDSLLYLSTTRIYKAIGDFVNEESDIIVNPQNPNDLYNISKIMGESIALSSGRKVRIARLSNVYGQDWTSQNFLFSLIKDALQLGHIHLQTALDSNKDYISIDDIVDCLLKIIQSGQSSIYNVASGVNVSNEEIILHLQSLTGCSVTIESDAASIKFPQIRIDRLKSEFDFQPQLLAKKLPQILRDFEQNKDKWQNDKY